MTQTIALDLFKIAEVELIYKGSNRDYRPQVSSSETAHELFRASWNLNKIELVEQFKVLLLDQSSRCLGIAEISTGGISSCTADPKIIFATALKARASGLVLAHNHPSGNLTESDADIALTKKLKEAGHFLDIGIMDHLILTASSYRSFIDEGLMP